MMLRQGDVPLVPTTTPIPDGANRIKPIPGQGLVLAHGEVTGHAHRITEAFTGRRLDDQPETFTRIIDGTPTSVTEAGYEGRPIGGDDVELWRDPVTEARFLRVLAEAGVLLRHEEHATIVVSPGVYRLPGQREYVDSNEWRAVAD